MSEIDKLMDDLLKIQSKKREHEEGEEYISLQEAEKDARMMIDRAVRREFIERFEPDFGGAYDCLIVLVGFSEEPLIRSIGCVNANRTVFIYTKETETKLDRIVNESGLGVAEIDKELVGGDSPDDVYDIIEKYSRRFEKVAVDITGGKKAMAGGAAIAAAFLGLDILYNDYTEYDAERRIPIPSKEYLALLRNPFETTQDLASKLAAEAFRRYDFATATILYGKAKERTRDPARKVVFEALCYASKAYHEWETFQLSNALGSLKKALSTLEGMDVEFDVDMERLRKHVEILKELSEVDSRSYYPDVLKDDCVVKHLAFTFLASAERKAEIERYEDAILRLYRCCELLAQHRLALIGINTNGVDASAFTKKEIEEYRHISAEIRNVHGGDTTPEKQDLPDRSGLVASYVMLLTKRDGLVHDKKDVVNLDKHAQARNLSYVEHGINVVKKGHYENMHRMTRNLMAKFCKISKFSMGDLSNYRIELPWCL
ncbi:MAG: TIGR02710 family CRISPR-associated CARF protein [Thermoplasmata archaeon]